MLTKPKEWIKNRIGFKSNRKILVIESDDWGSIRSHSIESIKGLEALGVIDHQGRDAQSMRYNYNDSLMELKDLNDLRKVLSTIYDSKGSNPKITAYYNLANPDYERIAKCDFQEFHFKSFKEQLKEWGEEETFEQHLELIKVGLVTPEFHGLTHLNEIYWMRKLQKSDRDFISAFEARFFGVRKAGELNTLEAFNFETLSDLPQIVRSFKSGIILFEEIFGIKPKVFCPPNGPLSSKIYPEVRDAGFSGIQVARLVFKEPIGSKKYRHRIGVMGKFEKNGLMFLNRNAFFEPNDYSVEDWESVALSNISQCFKNKKPAILSTHRVNYTSRLNKGNGAAGLYQLGELLRKIVAQWPDVEFMDTRTLVKVISEGK